MSEIARKIEEMGGQFKSVVEKQDATISELNTRLNQIEAASKRLPMGGDAREVKAPEGLGMYLRKNTTPATDTKELSVTSDGQGVTVRGDWSNWIAKLVRESSPVRQVAAVRSTESNELEVLVDRGEPDSGWIGEVDERTQTDTSFLTRHPIEVHEHYALPVATLQMLEDAQGSAGFNVEDWLQEKIATKFARAEASAFINGSGNGEPRGLLTYDFVPQAEFEWGSDPDAYTIGSQFSGADGDLTDADVLYDLVDSLKAPYLSGAGWMMSRAMRNRIRKLKDGEDRYLLEPSLSAGVPDSLLGYPVYLAEDFPALAADVPGALFGNFSQAYTVVDRVGIDIVRDVYTRPGFVRWYVRRRVGGALVNPEAVKALILGNEPA